MLKNTIRRQSLHVSAIRLATIGKKYSAYQKWNYSGISIYRSHIIRFQVFIVDHLCSRIKFHINNVIYFCIHCSPTYRFPAFFVVNHVPDTAFPTWILLDFSFEKKLKIEDDLFMWDLCCTPAPRVSDYVSIQSTPYVFFKQVPIVIVKSSKPRCFKDSKILPIKYHANSKAWMMTEIFCLFLHSLDTQMGAQKNKKKIKRFSMRTV
jgi:hypothetical protein